MSNVLRVAKQKISWQQTPALSADFAPEAHEPELSNMSSNVKHLRHVLTNFDVINLKLQTFSEIRFHIVKKFPEVI
jgi:hypothetical protein